MPKVTISLDEKEQIWLKEIIIDPDKDQALQFIKECIQAKIDAQEKAHCKPPF